MKGVYIAVLNEGTVRAELSDLLTKWTHWGKYNLYIRYCSEKPIENNRNKIVLDFIKSGYDYLLMIDDDIVPSQKYLEILDHDKDIVSGVCFAFRQGGVVPLILRWNGKDWNVMNVNGFEGVIEVEAMGTGAMAIHKRVFENKEMCRHPFESIWNHEGERIRGLDLEFCKKAKEQGFGVWCDLKQVCSHIVPIDLKEIYETMVRLELKAGALNDNYKFRRNDGQMPPKARNRFYLKPDDKKVKEETTK